MHTHILIALISIACVGCSVTSTSDTQEGIQNSVHTEVLDGILHEIETVVTNSNVFSNYTEVSNTTDNNTWENPLLHNNIAANLRQVQSEVPGILEIFATDGLGNNIGQTNITTDLFQADEQWWQDTYANGKGKSWYGELQFDDSVGANCIPLYVPVYDESGQLVVIIKALIHATALEHHIWRHIHEADTI